MEYLGDQDVDCYYNFGDGNGLECYVQYIYEDGGTYTITQTVVNDLVCGHRHRRGQRGRLRLLRPHGLHPRWRRHQRRVAPVVSGVTQYHLRITNRWGELVFESFDPDQPWLGQRATTGSTIAQTGCTCFTWPTSTKSGTHGRWQATDACAISWRLPYLQGKQP